ncbi:hypothetical protein LTR10_022281 [Elasticomyces elasticus]|uniref:Uncharacterized protein n=1 Tax=Exophiala sideris TaxID=1016849 RepID=A0ABR0J209_9EURO|nr:hypothetical protein LTR10_022281 [Elasticomyces elasticus]KAK5024045.1 hypothetical protein LTS07_008779 [Exophiala sideris]KAK5054757.1 hypothetical protein LTR69_008664 [Exophiala sideris]
MVKQPKEAWSSIVRGAVMSRLPASAPVVISTKAAKHYGTSCNSRWKSSRDRGFPKYKDTWTEADRCKIMMWFIYMNDELARGKKVPLPFYRNWAGHSPSGDTLRVRDQLYESTALLAPDHPEDVKVNCELTTDLNAVPKSLFVKKYRKSDGAPYCELNYKLQVENTQSGLMKYSLEVDGKEYSAVEASY